MRMSLAGSALIALVWMLSGCGPQPATATDEQGTDPRGNTNTGNNSGGGTVSVSADIAAFRDTTYVLVRQQCVNCHSGTGASPPPFANADVEFAYNAITSRLLVDKADPARSRIVVKLAAELHNCWSIGCPASSEAMRQTVVQWAALLGGNTGSTIPQQTFLRSASTTFASSQADSALSKRVNSNLVALYTFRESQGTTVNDISGVTPAMNLTLPATGVEWVAGQGLKLLPVASNTAGPKAQATVETSRKLFDMIAGGTTPSNEFTVEAWLLNANTTQTGPARIAAYALDNGNANFAVVQNTSTYGSRVRSSATAASTNGDPIVSTAAGTLTTTVTHVVNTFNSTTGRKFYLNGVDTGVTDASIPATLNNWNNTYLFTLGNTPANTRPWGGTLYLVAIYNRALTATQVQQNFAAGYEDRSELSFDISAVSGVAGAKIVMQASAVDRASYLFAKPTYVGPDPNGLAISGIQILLNDKLPGVGQAYRNVNAMVDAPTMELSSIGTVIAKDKGELTDTVALAFNTIGSQSVTVTEPAPGPLTMALDERTTIPVSGVRTYEQINNTMAALTGVSPTATGVATVFGQVRQQLPGNANVLSFLSSQQTGIAKLAVEYCDAMVENATLRNTFFDGTPAFEFASGVATAFNSQAKKDRITNTLITKMIGTNLTNQPTTTEAQTEIGTLLNDLIAASPNGDQVRTRANVKGACAAVLASAALMVN